MSNLRGNEDSGEPRGISITNFYILKINCTLSLRYILSTENTKFEFYNVVSWKVTTLPSSFRFAPLFGNFSRDTFYPRPIQHHPLPPNHAGCTAPSFIDGPLWPRPGDSRTTSSRPRHYCVVRFLVGPSRVPRPCPRTLIVQRTCFDEQKQVNETFYESTLTILQVDQLDYGDYTCIATNALGRTTSVNRLTVFSHPDPPFNLRSANSTYDTITLNWSPGFDGGTTVP